MDDVLIILGCAIRGKSSGGDALILSMARAWSEKGATVTVLTTPEGEEAIREIRADRVNVRTVSSFGADRSITLSYLLRTIALVRASIRFVRERPRCICISTSPFFPDTIPGFAAALLGNRWVLSWQLAIPKPWVGYRSANDPAPPLRFPRLGPTLSYISERVSLMAFRRRGDAMLVANQDMVESARRSRIPEQKTHVVSGGIFLADVERATERSKEMDVPAADAIFLGRFHEQKGLEDLPEIWRRVSDVIPEARLAIVGGGDENIERRLRRAFETIGSRHVAFLGPRTGDEKYALLERAKVFLFPSYYESWGYVALEAMSVGLPVVGYDIPSSRLAFGDALTYAELGDSAGFAQRVIEILTDGSRRTELAEKSRRFAQAHDWYPIADELMRQLSD